jgi:DNA-binding CsgD family transcriptional regulator
MRDPLRTTPGPIPEVVHSVAGSTRRRGRAGDRRGRAARVQAADGSWWTVHGSVADVATGAGGIAARTAAPGGRTGSGPAGWEVTVIVTPASGGELTGMMMSALRLSPGERAVCEHLLAGLPTKVIAAEMSLSAHTVEDRLKVIFAKAAVASRQELVARLNPAGTPR